MLSNLLLNMQVVPNPVEQFKDEKYTQVSREQVSVVAKPSDLSRQHLAHETVKAHIMNSGSYSLSPFSFNWNQHSQIYTIISIFKKYSNHVVLSSCRVDAIAKDPGLVQLINFFGSTNLTCAVEGISTQIRNFLKKSVTPEELYVGLAHIIQQDFASVKFYYIYTGLEGEEDVAELEEFLAKLDELRKLAGKPTFPMRLSFTPLLNTLGTTLQFAQSQVSRSVKVGSRALHQIKHVATRYGFGVRLSTSIASSDFAQSCEFLDRRGMGVLEYASLNGIYTFPRVGIAFYEGEVEISKTEYDKLPQPNRIQLNTFIAYAPRDQINWLIANRAPYQGAHTVAIGQEDGEPRDTPIAGWETFLEFSDTQLNHIAVGTTPLPMFLDQALEQAGCPRETKFFRIDSADRVTVNKLYSMLNNSTLYAERSVPEIIDLLRAADGKPVPQFVIDAFPAARAKGLLNKKLKLSEQEGDHYVHTYPNGKKAYHMMINVSVDDLTMDTIKTLIPIFTNGQTFNDIAEEKTLFTVFPSSHIRSHESQHSSGTLAKDYIASRAFLYDGYCFTDSVGHCNNCGLCDTTHDVKHTSGDMGGKEHGSTHFNLISDVVRDSEPHQKLLIEVRVAPGKFAAMSHTWFKYAVTRAFLRASKGDLVEPLISERYVHSRQGYRLKSDSFKNILGGSLLMEFTFNSLAQFTEDSVQQLLQEMKQYATEGWEIVSIALKPRDFILKNSLEYAYTVYRFDDRRVNNISLDSLRKKIDLFMNSDASMTYKKQEAAGRWSTRVVETQYDKANILAMSAGMGRHRHETVLKVFGKVQDSHPLIFLAGFLGMGEGKGGAKSYVGLYGTDVIIEGFYKKPTNDTNLFNMVDSDTAMGDTMNTRCAATGDLKFINVMSGRPFGNMPYERDPVLDLQYGPGAVGQFYHMSFTN